MNFQKDERKKTFFKSIFQRQIIHRLSSSLILSHHTYLQVNLETCGNELRATHRQLEESQNAREVLTSKLMELTVKMDTANINLSELSKDRESLQRSLDSLRTDKHSVDKEKVELNLMVEALSMDLEKSQNAKSHLQKMYDILLEEKKMLDLDLQCVRKDKEITEMNLRYELLFGEWRRKKTKLFGKQIKI